MERGRVVARGTSGSVLEAVISIENFVSNL